LDSKRLFLKLQQLFINQHLRLMTELSNIRFDPFAHPEGIADFMNFFGVKSEAPTGEFLRTLLRSFARLPYENISKIIKLNRNLDSPNPLRLPEEVISDHVRHHLGGTCFSLTYFLQTILTHHGFISYSITAHMRNRPNVHCALIAICEGKKWLLDPGYLLNDPMEIDPDRPRIFRSPHTGVELRFDRETELYHLYTFDHQQSKWRYCFHDQPLSFDEFLRYWLASFHASTMHGICITQLSENGMIYLHNDFLQVSQLSGKKKQRIHGDVQKVIESIFQIDGDWVDEALTAIGKNMRWEQEQGLFVPRKKVTDETI